MNETISRADLLMKIQQLSFAKVETELFLDTHPDCRQALDYYKRTVDELETAMAQYQNLYGPLRAEGAVIGDKWTWTDGPWPWQNEEARGGKK